MKLDCQFSSFTKGATCEHCGFALKRDYRNGYLRACKAQQQLSQCPHLLDPTGESAQMFNCGCASSRANGVETSVFACALYGVCVPFVPAQATGVLPMKCSVCPDNTVAARSL